MELERHIEDPDFKKSLRTCPSSFAPTDTSIENFLAGIIKYHLTVGRITVQDELEQFAEGCFF